MEYPVLCMICNGPSALWDTREDGKRYRLAKTMLRVTGKPNPDPTYVHESPCLKTLVENWANYIVKAKSESAGGLKELGKPNE